MTMRDIDIHGPGQGRAGGCDLVVQAPHLLREDLEILLLLTGAEGIEPVERAESEASRLYVPQQMAGVSEACAAAGYDWALVPRERALARVRLVAMDMDSTLITIECIDEIAALQGIGDDVAAITAAAMRGDIDFRSSLERRVALLAGVPIAVLERVYDADAKVARLSELARELRGPDGLTVAIGDGANDLPMMDAADVSVAYRAKPRVRAHATHAIDHCGLDAALNLFI
jgi:phosphoserine phosphatase